MSIGKKIGIAILIIVVVVFGIWGIIDKSKNWKTTRGNIYTTEHFEKMMQTDPNTWSDEEKDMYNDFMEWSDEN